MKITYFHIHLYFYLLLKRHDTQIPNEYFLFEKSFNSKINGTEVEHFSLHYSMNNEELKNDA